MQGIVGPRFLISFAIIHLLDSVYIDKIALVDLKNRKFLGTLSHGKDVWYVPGGKREKDETDEATLVREIHEELGVEIIPDTLELFGIFKAQAHGKPKGTFVRNTCYRAQYNGIPQPMSEIAKIGYFNSNDASKFSEVNQQMIKDLLLKDLID